MTGRPARAPLALRGAMLLLAAALAGGCDDSRLERAQRTLDRDLIELEAIASDTARFRFELRLLDERRAQAAAEFERARLATKRAAQELGSPDEERLVPSEPAGWATVQLSLRRGGTISSTLTALRTLDLPRSAWVNAVRCTTLGCTVVLSAERPPTTTAATAPSRRRALPPRPWWPSHARRWDRLRAEEEEIAKLRAALGDVEGIRARQQELLGMINFLGAMDHADRTGELLRLIDAARAAGVRAFEARRTSLGLELVAPGAPPGLAAALRKLGGVSEQDGVYTVLPLPQRDPPRIPSGG